MGSNSSSNSTTGGAATRGTSSADPAEGSGAGAASATSGSSNGNGSTGSNSNLPDGARTVTITPNVVTTNTTPATPSHPTQAAPGLIHPTQSAPGLIHLGWELTGGGGFLAPTPRTLSLLLGADAALFLGPHLRFGLLGAFSFGGSVPIVDDAGRQRGTLSAQSAHVLPHAMACLELPFVACGGVRAGVRLAIGTSSGDYIFQTRVGVSPGFSAGPALHLALRFSAFTIALDPTLVFNSPTVLGVDGLPTTIATPTVEFLLQLGVGAGAR